MRIAVQGCSHGCLDQIYSTILSLDRKAGKRTSLLLLCGDVQTVRNQQDLHCLAVPDKHKQMGDFHYYYSGQRKAPILTLMIGGNHEASNYLWELYHGGWVAPNIYYLGAAGCVEVGGLSIAGISGIYKSHDYTLGRFESMPYNSSTVRSIYHTRIYDTFRLHLLSKLTAATHKPDIVLSHDWPNTIEQRGDVTWLKRRKPFFVDEINSSSLGSPPLWKLLEDVRPKYWFSAHLHVRFAALYKHSGEASRVKKGAKQNHEQVHVDASTRPYDEVVDESVETRKGNAEEMAIDMSDDEEASQLDGTTNPEAIQVNDLDDIDEESPVVKAHHHSAHNGQQDTVDTFSQTGATRFLALSKCLQGQDFLQILDVPAPSDTEADYRKDLTSAKGEETPEPSFRFSVPWLAVIKATKEYLSLEKKQKQLPKEKEYISHIKKQEEWLRSRFSQLQNSNPDKTNVLDIERTQQFVKTAPATSDPDGHSIGPPPWYTNPQTVALCSLLEMENCINPPPPSDAPLQKTAVGQALVSPPFHHASEEEEIRKIEEAAQAAMKRKKHQESNGEEPEREILTLFDDDETNARWKEGSG